MRPGAVDSDQATKGSPDFPGVSILAHKQFFLDPKLAWQLSLASLLVPLFHAISVSISRCPSRCPSRRLPAVLAYMSFTCTIALPRYHSSDFTALRTRALAASVFDITSAQCHSSGRIAVAAVPRWQGRQNAHVTERRGLFNHPFSSSCCRVPDLL